MIVSLCFRNWRNCYLNSSIKLLFSKRISFSCVVEKNMPKPGFYAVRIGKIPGVYTNWNDCECQVKGFPNAVYKKFPSLALAKNFLAESSTAPNVQRQSVSKDVQQKSTSSRSYEIDSELLDAINDSNFFNNCDFEESLMPVITSASDLSTITPLITYPSSARGSYYAVHRGKRPGVYQTWTDCEKQIKDYRNASYRKFDNEKDALEYVRTGGIQKANKRELRELDYDNRVIKKRKLDRTVEYVLENPNEPVVIFTDGASSENGKKRSRAGIGVYWGHNHPLNTSKRITGRQTNNRAEIYAAVHALHQAKQIGAKKVKLFTDSQFVIHAITDWIKKWKANGWKLVTGKDVVNKEDLIALDAAREGLDVEWIYVKAHARNRGNDEADRLAVAGSRLILEPKNCSEFQNTESSASSVTAAEIQPFLLTSASSSSEEILPLVLPDTQIKKPYYAVHRGRNPGVYSTWTECEAEIKDFAKPCFRKFFSEEEAKQFVKTGKVGKIDLKVPECKEDEYVTVFTDGASSCNGQEEARAGIGVYWGPGNALNTSMRLPGRQTNNRAEIFAAVHALRQAKMLGIKNIRIYTDSKFVINGITSWIKNWKENGWRGSNGKVVTNKEDFIALDNACQGLNIDWCYVKGHANNPGNTEADKLAVAGCNKSVSDTIILT